MDQGGYAAKTPRVNLGNLSTKEERLPVKLARDYLGGAGFAIKCPDDELKAGSPAPREGDKRIFAVGPLAATGAPAPAARPWLPNRLLQKRSGHGSLGRALLCRDEAGPGQTMREACSEKDNSSIVSIAAEICRGLTNSMGSQLGPSTQKE
jgi:hypothetical protein